MPLNLDALKASKLGKLIIKLTKEPPTPGELISPSFMRRISLPSPACLGTLDPVEPGNPELNTLSSPLNTHDDDRTLDSLLEKRLLIIHVSNSFLVFLPSLANMQRSRIWHRISNGNGVSCSTRQRERRRERQSFPTEWIQRVSHASLLSCIADRRCSLRHTSLSFLRRQIQET